MFALGCQDHGVTKFNNDPDATIRSPSEGAKSAMDVLFTASGSVDDDDHATEDLVARWYVDGELACETDVLSDGETSCELMVTGAEAVIRLEVEDPMGATGADEVKVTGFNDTPPTIELFSPESGRSYYEDQKVQISGAVADEDPEDTPDVMDVVVSSNVDGELETALSSDGTFLGSVFLTKGEHTLTAQVTDSYGVPNAITESVSITVGGPNNDPTCQITAPDPDLAVAVEESFSLEGLILDMDLAYEFYPELVSVTWVSSLEGVLHTGAPDTSGLTIVPIESLRRGTHLITLQAEDEVGGRCADTISLEVGDPPTLSVLEPEEGGVYGFGEPIVFRAIVSDGEDSATEITMDWETTDDGLFSTQGPDSTGVVEFAVSHLEAGSKTLTVTATDSGGLWTSELVSFSINELPSAPEVQLTTEADTGCFGVDLFTTDALYACITTHSTDPDGDPVTYAYEWYRDGFLVEGLDGPVVSAMETARGEAWRVVVTPSDTLSEGYFGQSTVTIRNSAPVVEGLSLSPDPARTNDDLTCVLGAVVDPDGDPATYAYSWTVNGVVVAETSDVLASSNYAKGDEVTCLVTPADDSDIGEPTPAAPMTIANTAPSVAAATISPEFISTGDTLVCGHVGFFDVDGVAEPDETFYRWTINGIHVEDGPTLTGGFSGGDLIACEAVPFDGEDEGLVVEATTEVSNSSPVIASVSITPSAPTAVDTLTCAWDGWYDADGDADASTAVWTVDGVEMGTGTTLAGAFSGGQLVSCSVTPFDGSASGVMISTSVMVLNTPPTADEAVISPNPGTVSDELTCMAVGYTDPDIHDLDESIYQWSINGLPAGTEPSISEGYVGGDEVSCTLTPFDGTTYGTPMVATMEVTNTPATVAWVNLGPSGAKADDSLNCTWAAPTDPDGHPLSVTATWTIDGVYAGEGPVFESGHGAGDVVACSVTVNDGMEEGPPTTASITIENTLPSIDGVAISPDPARATDALTCAWSGFTDIDGDPDLSIASWSINGLFAGVGPTLASGHIGADVVSCTVIPSDGRDTSDAIAEFIVIANSAPSVDTVTISPDDAMVGDELTCSYSGYTDVDGDADASTYTWYVNEVEVALGDKLVGSFAGGDTIRCEVNPHDGMDWGTPVSGSQTISNSAPSITDVWIDPVNPRTADLVTCNWGGYSDPDGHPDASMVEWFVDGVSIGTGPTIEDGFTAGDTLTCEVTPHDSFEAGTPKSHSATVSNAPPSIASVYITPSTPRAGNVLTCNWGGYSDPEGDPDASTVEWFINGTSAGTGDKLHSGHVHGDVVGCEVLPSDGMDDGAIVSAETTILNTNPTIGDLRLDPDPVFRTSEVSCVWDTYTDPDGEPDLSTVEWELNGVLVSTESTLPSGMLAEDDELRCTVQAFDGTDTGNTIGIVRTVAPSIPQVDTVTITPDAVYKDSELICTWDGFFDADGDPDLSSVVWTVNGVVASTTPDLSDAFEAEDVVVCEVTPYDGEHFGEPVSSTIYVGNAPPVIYDVAMTPNPAYDGDTLTCVPGYTEDVDGTTFFTYDYRWSVAGVDVPGVFTDTLPSGYFVKDQNVQCRVRANDGSDYGDFVAAPEAYILNTPPVINSVSIGPGDAKTNDIVSASVDATDIDGDELVVSYSWYVSGVPISSFPSLNGATDFEKGDTVYLEVTVSDGEDDSAPAISETITILNTPPIGPTVEVTPTDPVTGADSIVCSMAGEGDDVDGDDLTYTISWLRDGEEWSGATSTTVETDDTIEAENLKSYETWTCLITPNDGSADGAPGAESAEVQTIFAGWGTINVGLGDADLKINGEDNKDYSGRAVAWAGDVDGDDRSDILIAAPDNDDAGTGAGKVYLLRAGDYDGYASIPLNDVAIAWTGSASGNNLGGYVQSKSLSSAGDIDGDGLDDILIGEPLYSNPSTGGTDGRAYMVFAASISATGPVSIPSITTADYTFQGRAYSQLGHSIRLVGDVDGRGVRDIMLGAPSADGGKGQAYLLWGEDFGSGGTLNMASDPDVTFTGELPGDDAGLRMTDVGDVDADGLTDILMAAPSNDVGGESKAGRSYLFTSAGITGSTHTMSLDADWLFNGENSNDLSGHAMAELGDLDKDGYGDFMLSAKGQDTFGSNSGVVYVINGGLLPMFRTINLEDAWFKIGGEAAGDRAGHDLAFGGDVDADGRGDLLISAYANDAGGSSAGRTYLVLGDSIPSEGGSMTLSDTDYAFTGESLADSSGYSIAGNGDFDADGLSDILIGAYLRDSTDSDAGTTYMFVSPSVYH